MISTKTAAAAGAALFALATAAYAQEMPGGRGPGMMDPDGNPGMGYPMGYGPGSGMMGGGPGYGPGYGMGPGMMQGRPGYGPGYGMGYGPGYGMGYGPGYGMGYGMGYGPAYGMGPGMMGGWMPDPGRHCREMMERGWGSMMCAGPEPMPHDLTVEEVTHMMGHRIARLGIPNLKLGEVKARDDDVITAEVVTGDGAPVQQYEIDRHTGAMRPAGEVK